MTTQTMNPNGNIKIWTPRFTTTPAVAKDLMEIEAAKGVIEVTAVPPEVASEFLSVNSLNLWNVMAKDNQSETMRTEIGHRSLL